MVVSVDYAKIRIMDIIYQRRGVRRMIKEKTVEKALKEAYGEGVSDTVDKILADLHPYRYVRLLGETKTMGDIIKKYEDMKNET